MSYKKPKEAKYYYYKGFPTNYVVYPDGRVYDLVNDEFVEPRYNNSGYLIIPLIEFNTIRGVHQMVAEMFIPNPDKKKIVNHKDGCKDHNWVENLEWFTQSENNLHAYATGLRKPNTPDKVHFTKYSEDQIRKACELMSTGMMLKQVEEQTGVPVRTLGEIRSGRIWKSISCDFTFPEKHYVSSELYDTEFREKVTELYNQGYRASEIMKILNVAKDDERLRKAVWYITGRLKKGLNDHRKTMRDYTLESSRVRDKYISETEGPSN